MAAPLTLQLFGPMRAQVDGQPLPPMRSRKARWLLALLALQGGQPVGREWLAGNLWPDAEQTVALANLRPIVSELRRALGGQGARLRTLGRKMIALDLEGAEIDVVQFDLALASGDLDAAVAAYHGPLLEDCQEPWVMQARGFREEACLEALAKLARGAETELAVAYRRRAVAIAPLRDATRRELMDALAKSGDLNAALETYREFAQAVRGETGGIPDGATTEMYHRLRMEAGSKSRAARTAEQEQERPPVIGYLPHPLTRIVGREDERLDLADRLRRFRLVSLTGFGGIGKTRLAREVAADLANESADGVWFVTLESIVEERLLPHRIATVLGLGDATGLVDHLRPKRVLLVLDNCEHLTEPCARLCETLLSECGHLRILVTSREPLGLVGEKVWRVTPLSVPNPTHLPSHPATRLRVVESYESVQLFLQRAQALDETFRLTLENAETVASICAQLEGIPLAIELAAARVKAMTVDQVRERLQDPLGFLSQGGHTSVARQQTLRTMLDWSYGLLKEAPREMFRRVSLFVGGWTLEAVEAICDGGGIQRADVSGLLASLVDKSLVVFERETPTHEGRYRMLEPVRQYAAALSGSGDPALQERFVGFYRALCERASPLMRSPEQAKWLEKMKLEEGNIRQAVQWMEERDDLIPSMLPLVDAWGTAFFVAGRYQEGLQVLERALSLAPADGSRGRAGALSKASVLAHANGNFVLALDRQTEALEIYQRMGDHDEVAFALHALGDAHLGVGRFRTARHHYEESYRMHRELGKDRGAAVSAIRLGSCLSAAEDLEGAIRWIGDGKQYFDRTQEQLGIAWALGILGNAYLDNDQAALAIPCYAEALKLELEHGPQRTMYTLDNLAKANAVMGDFASAEEYLDGAFALAGELGDEHFMTSLMASAGEIAGEREDYAQARDHALRALKRLRETDCPLEATAAFRILATAQLGLGQMRAGLEILAAANGIRERMEIEISKDERLRYRAGMEKALAALGRGEFDRVWKKGWSLSMAEAFERALAEPHF